MYSLMYCGIVRQLLKGVMVRDIDKG